MHHNHLNLHLITSSTTTTWTNTHPSYHATPLKTQGIACKQKGEADKAARYFSLAHSLYTRAIESASAPAAFDGDAAASAHKNAAAALTQLAAVAGEGEEAGVEEALRGAVNHAVRAHVMGEAAGKPDAWMDAAWVQIFEGM